MRHLILSLALVFGLEQGEACVKYNPSTGTYTVDPSGSVRPYKKKEESSDTCQSFNKMRHKKKNKHPKNFKELRTR